MEPEELPSRMREAASAMTPDSDARHLMIAGAARIEHLERLMGVAMRDMMELAKKLQAR
jgi:hypothetical protein